MPQLVGHYKLRHCCMDLTGFACVANETCQVSGIYQPKR